MIYRGNTTQPLLLAKITINISEYEWCECSIDNKIYYLYKEYYKLCEYRVANLKGLDEHTKKECILDAMWEVAKKPNSEYESVKDIKNLLCTITYNKCYDKLRHTIAKKRGGEVNTYSLEDQYEDQLYTDTNILDVETTLYLQQLKEQLTAREYEFVQLILKEPHILTNTEYASIMQVSEATIRKLKKTLQTKLNK